MAMKNREVCCRPLRKRYLQRTASWCTGHSAQGGSRYCIDRTWRHKALPTWISAAVNGLRSPRGRAPACTYSQRRHLPARPSSLRLVGLLVRGMQTGRFVSGQHPTQRLSNSTRVRTVPDPPSPAPPERSEAMHPSRPCLRLLCSHLTLLLSLTLLAGLAGCGPASSDNAPNLGPSASVGGPLLSKQGPSPRNDPFTSAASPVPLALVNGPGAAAGTGTVPGGDSPHAVPVLASEPGHPVDGLVVPEWMAQKLNSPNVRVRLRALETWAQSAPPGAVDPLILAFEDKDERVRARAQQLIEQDWARKAEAEQ
jgi:hypothetical protein